MTKEPKKFTRELNILAKEHFIPANNMSGKDLPTLFSRETARERERERERENERKDHS